MFVRIATDQSPRPNSLRDFGMTSESNPIVSLSEFTYKKGTEVYGEKEPAEYVYQVKVGAVRSYKLLSDGRRQIGAFHLAGDIFGLENGGEHRFTAEAIVNRAKPATNTRFAPIRSPSAPAVRISAAKPMV